MTNSGLLVFVWSVLQYNVSLRYVVCCAFICGCFMKHLFCQNYSTYVDHVFIDFHRFALSVVSSSGVYYKSKIAGHVKLWYRVEQITEMVTSCWDANFLVYSYLCFHLFRKGCKAMYLDCFCKKQKQSCLYSAASFIVFAYLAPTGFLKQGIN